MSAVRFVDLHTLGQHARDAQTQIAQRRTLRGVSRAVLPSAALPHRAVRATRRAAAPRHVLPTAGRRFRARRYAVAARLVAAANRVLGRHHRGAESEQSSAQSGHGRRAVRAAELVGVEQFSKRFGGRATPRAAPAGRHFATRKRQQRGDCGQTDRCHAKRCQHRVPNRSVRKKIGIFLTLVV